MVTKGIITSIDFNGNTCQVRIPLFETAGNDPITGTAIVSNTPGSYNGYKVGDVVLVAFEDGKMQNPVIVGKLYLGAAKEKQDPRGTINVETTTASKSASLPADAVLTANVDSNVPNTNTPFGSLASIANNLNSLNTDVNQLDRFTRNQFNSIITDVNDQGEQLRSEIKQTAENIEANVVHKHQNGTQDALGWNLDEKEWKINAQDTVNGAVKDINIVTIDRNGMSIAGDLKLSGYPKNTTIRYAQNNSDKKYPTPLYDFTKVEFPVPFPSGDEDKDKTWYYGKYIKITEAGEEKYVLVFKENFERYKEQGLIKPGETIAYDRNINSETWSIKIPGRANGQYIWQWTHTESFLFDKNTNSWDEQDDDKVVCITGADGAPGAAGYNTATVLLYKRKTKTESVPTINWTNDLTYTFATHSLSSVPSGWSTTIPAPVANDGGLYVTVAIAYSNTGTDTIPSTEWTIPSLYVENGEDGNDSTSYWLKLSSPIHLGVNQKSDITISPMSQTGTEGEKQDTAFIRYYFEGETTPNWPSSASTLITIPKEDLINKNLVVEATHSASGTPYANETITYSSLTSPTMDLSRDSGAINYDSDGMTKTGSDISSTATVYLGETEYSGATSFSWTLSPNGYASSDYEISGDKKTITIKNCWADTVSATCTAICTGRSGTVLVPTLKPLYKKEKYKVDSGVKKVLVEKADKPYWEWTAGGATQKVALTDTEIKQQYITLEKTFTVTKQIKGDQGEGGVSVATVQLFKRSSNAITTKPVSTNSNYWTYYFTGANAGKAVLTGTDSIWGDCSSSIPAGSDPVYETHAAVITIPGGTSAKIINWSTPTKFVENGAAGVSIIQNKQWYILWPADNKNEPGKPDAANKLDKPDATPTTLRMWIPIPPEAVNDYVVWTCYESIFSDGHSEYSVPVKDNAYALAQGKTTNYYSNTDPSKVYSVKKGDCWFKTISSTDDGYNNEMSDKSQGKLYQCSGFGANGKAIWEDIGGELVTNKLTANYINALDITAKKITVLQDNSKESNDSNPILFQADGTSNNSGVKIGGFTVDSNRLYAGTPGTSNSIELASSHKLIAYKSNNQGIALSYAVSKITVNKDITNLTVYIRSYAETYYDYIMISNPNVPSYPTTYLSNYVKAYTMGNQNSSSALASYKKVEYYGLKQNDCIYVVYKKDGNTDSGTGTGYLLIPETTDISIEAVDDTYYFVRDTSLDTKEPGASLKVGSNFSVDSAGAIKSTSGTIGKLAIDENGLSYGDRFKIDPTVDNWGSAAKQKATVVAGSTLVQKTLILPGQSKDYYDQWSYYWPAFDQDGFKVLYTANWTDNSNETYKLGEYNLWDLAGIPIVSSYNHTMTLEESLACFGEDRTKIYGWGAPIIYTAYHITVGQDWFEVDLNYPTTNNIRKILTVVCTPYVQPTIKTINNKVENTAQVPNQSVNLFVSYDNYSNGKFWIRSNTKEVTVSILAIGVAAITKVRQ